MNKIIFMGRLVKDVELRYSQGAKPLAVGRFRIAVPRKKKSENGPEADFFNCVSFGAQAEYISKYMHKGTKVLLTGRVENDSYINKDNVEVYYTSVIVEDIEFAESKSASEGGGTTGATSGTTNAGAPSVNRSNVNAGVGSVNSNTNVNAAGATGNSFTNTGGFGLPDGFMNIPEGIEEEFPFNC